MDARESLGGILAAVEKIAGTLPVVYPVHPRSRKALDSSGLADRAGVAAGLLLTEPMGYHDFIALEAQARFVMTDSGGVQEETTVLGVPCLTLRENTERPVTVACGTNRVVGTEPERIVEAAETILAGDVPRPARQPELWDGRASERIADILKRGKDGITE